MLEGGGMAFVPIVYRHQECRKLSTPLMDDGESTGKSREMRGGGCRGRPAAREIGEEIQ